MTIGTALWAGRHLSPDEEAGTRRVVAFLRGLGDDATADNLERFLPENDDGWTPDELERGAHVGPWLSFAMEVGTPDAA
jgi:hypothetical protein